MRGSVQDGYFGHLGEEMLLPRDQKEHVRAWPLKLRKRPSILRLKFDGASYYWTCTECGWCQATTRYRRPEHDCQNSS